MVVTWCMPKFAIRLGAGYSFNGRHRTKWHGSFHFQSTTIIESKKVLYFIRLHFMEAFPPICFDLVIICRRASSVSDKQGKNGAAMNSSSKEKREKKDSKARATFLELDETSRRRRGSNTSDGNISKKRWKNHRSNRRICWILNRTTDVQRVKWFC